MAGTKNTPGTNAVTGEAGADVQAPKSNPADEVGADQAQAAFDEANEKGFFGEQVDETPRENFTLRGVTGK